MTFELPVDSIVLTASALLVAGVLLAGSSTRFPVPASILSLGLGMLVGSDVLGWVYLDDAEFVRDIAVVALVIILFEGGLTTKPGALREGGAAGFLLSNVGVLITGGLVALGVRSLLSTDWTTALVLGAVVASTDAAAVFDLLRRAPLPRRVAGILEVESGANDPFAILLTVGILESLDGVPSTSDWLVFGASQLVGGLVVGVIVGLIGTRVMRLELRAEGFYALMATGLAGTAYGLAAAIGGSGFLAVYVAGLLIGDREHRHRRSIRGFHTSLASGADIALFLLLGLLVFPSRLPAVAVPALALAAILVFIARPVAVFVCSLPFRLTWREQTVLAWGGLRGAVPIVLATFPATYGLQGGDVIFDVVFFVVLTSVLLQGTTMVALVRKLGMASTRPAWRSVAEVLPLTDSDFDLAEIEVPPDLQIVGRPLSEAGAPEGVRVLAVVRDHRVMIPTGDTVIAAGDMLVLAVDRDAARTLDLADWIQSAGR